MLMRWLEKATFSTADVTAPAGGGLLSPQQAREFLRILIDESVLLKEANNQTSLSPKFEVPRISFGSRILRSGVEGARLADGDRVKPLTGLVTLSTNLFKGEVPVSDELFEDNIERDALADTIMVMIAEAVGRDVEEYAIKNDTDRTGADGADNSVLGVFDGLIKQLQTGLPAPGPTQLRPDGAVSKPQVSGRVVGPASTGDRQDRASPGRDLPPGRLHRRHANRDEPGRRPLLQPARDGGAVDQGRQSRHPLDLALLPPGPGQ